MPRPPTITGSAARISPRHEHHACVRQLHGFRRSRRAGRVDERQHVVGLAVAPGILEAKTSGLSLAEVRQRDRAVRLSVHQHDVLDLGRTRGQDLRQEHPFRHDDATPGTLQQVVDLLRRQRVVHRECDRSEMHGCSIGQRELRAIDQHQRYRVAAADAERVQPGRQRLDPLGMFAECELDAAVERPVRDLPWALGRRELEGLAKRSRFKRLDALAVLVVDFVDQWRMSPISATG